MAQLGTYSWTGGTRSTRRTLFTRRALCKARNKKKSHQHLALLPRRGAAARVTVTPWDLQEDQVGPGDRRSLCDPSCLCHPVHQFHLCHHGDLVDPGGGGRCVERGPGQTPTPHSWGCRSTEEDGGEHQLTAGPRAPAGPAGPAGPWGPWNRREGDRLEHPPPSATTGSGQRHPEPAGGTPDFQGKLPPVARAEPWARS